MPVVRHLKIGLDKIKPVRALAIMLSFHALFSSAYILLFWKRFHTDVLVVPLHILLVLGMVSITILLMGLPLISDRFRNWRLARFIIALIPAIGFTVLVFLYIANVISNSFWGSNINYSLTRNYTFRLAGIIKELPIASSWIYLPLVGVAILILSTYLCLSGYIFRGLEQLFSRDRDYSLFKSRRRGVRSCLALILLLVIFGEFMFVVWEQRKFLDYIWQEPILGFFIGPSGSLDRFSRDSLAIYRDRLLREQYPHNQRFDRKNVIFIISDALRADHLQLYGYARPTTPFLCRMYESGSLRKVTFALSNCAETTCGVESILSSRRLENLHVHNFTIFDLLHDQGYATYFIISSDHDLYGLKEYYGQDVSLYFDYLNADRFPINDDRVLFEGIEKVPDFAGTPAFFYIHLMSSHYSGVKLDQYHRYLPDGKKIDVLDLLRGKYDPSVVIDNYDDKVTQADDIIRMVFDALRQKGYLNDTIVVISADHGDGLGEHGRFGHVQYVYQEQIRIPMLIYDESKAKYADIDSATQMDISPTVIDRLGLKVPASWEGTSLLRPVVQQYTYHLSSNRGVQCYAVLFRTQKEIYKYLRFADTGKEEVYELTSDPHEERSILEQTDPALVRTLRDKANEHFQETVK
jgi:glucan phosphoethanolaminetransferase (alkaline phosphatase superfamily)